MAAQIGLEVLTVTIANGTALSPAVGLGAKRLLGISMPSAWTTADLTFQVSVDGGTTWQEMFDTANNAIDFKAAANEYLAVDITLWRGVNNIKVRSGTSSVPVNQAADRAIGLVVAPV